MENKKQSKLETIEPIELPPRYSDTVLRLANKIGNKKHGTTKGLTASYTWDAPEYMILEPLVSDEMAEVAMGMDFRVPKTVEEIAAASGKDIETTRKCIYELADVGVCFLNVIDGADKFWYDTWIPGVMEMINNHPTNPYKYPQVARAFEAYGRVRGPASAGKTPVGIGLMRVIPIETAIDGNSKSVSYEQVMFYLDEAERKGEKFCVTNCSCRTAREIIGEGCGHLKEDMCIQMGHAAEYYIRTGRAREIQKSEAIEIMKRAEENGLMHQIPNTDGSGKTHAICNCCGCGCFSLRTGTMFKNVDMVRSNYLAEVDRDNCVACGQCVENCPMNAIQLGQKIACSAKVVDDITTKVTPRDYKWTEANWNTDYRINRKNTVETGTAPCKTACPAHIAVQGYIRLAAQGKYMEALELIKKENPFPAVCGRICNRSCESECTRGNVDDPVAIDEIKKFIAQLELETDNRFVPKKRHDYSDKRIAIIGGGPAGLSCAYYLALDNYSVTVFEKNHSVGGMLKFGIPSFRLEKDVVDAEIKILSEMGVEFKTGVEVGKDVTISGLREQGYSGFYLAIGAQNGRKLGIEGEDATGVFAGVEFLRNVNLNPETVTLARKTVVIGGGNVAIDVARTSVRVGSETTSLFCLESREIMPAMEEECEEAEAEGVEICNSWGPKRIIVEDGKVCGVEFKKCVSVFDANGKFAPEYSDETLTVDCDNVLISVGQAFDYGTLLEGTKVEFNANGTVAADALTYQTAEPDIFVGGDVHTGPKFAIDAIAAGKQGAISLHRFVQPGQTLYLGRDKREYAALDTGKAIVESFDTTSRQKPGEIEVAKAKNSFRDARGTFTEEQLKKETERCLGCGAAIIDDYMCVGCGQCTTKCKFDAIHLKRVYDGEGVSFEKMKPIILKTAVKTMAKIQVRKIKDAFSSKNA